MRYLIRRSLIVFILAILCMAGLSMTGYAEKSQGGILELVGNVVVDADQVINGDVQAMAGSVTVHGVVNGTVTAMAGNVTIYGKVHGDVNCTAGNVYVKKDAVVEGTVTAMAGKVFKDENATIKGSVVEMAKAANNYHSSHHTSYADIMVSPRVPWFILIWGIVTGLVSWLALGAILMLFFAKHVQVLAVAQAARPGYYFCMGFVAMLLAPPVMVLLALTIVGIPVVILLGLLLFIATIFGQLGVARVIGERIIERFNISNKTEMAKVLIGIVAIFLITLVPILGWLFFFVTACIGLGGALINRMGIEKKGEEI